MKKVLPFQVSGSDGLSKVEVFKISNQKNKATKLYDER